MEDDFTTKNHQASGQDGCCEQVFWPQLKKEILYKMQGISQSVQADITKPPWTEWLKHSNLFLTAQGWKFSIRVPAQAGSSEGLLPGLQIASFCLWPHKLERESSGPFF